MGEEKRPEWMSSISAIVDPEDYLLGRKIDKTFELSQKEKADRAREARIELISKDKVKLSDDPILDLERRRRELKMRVINNPVLLKQLRDKLIKEERNKAGLTSHEIGSETEPPEKRESERGTDLVVNQSKPIITSSDNPRSRRDKSSPSSRDRDPNRHSSPIRQKKHSHDHNDRHKSESRRHGERRSSSESSHYRDGHNRDSKSSRSKQHHKHKSARDRDASRSRRERTSRDHHRRRSRTPPSPGIAHKSKSHR